MNISILRFIILISLGYNLNCQSQDYPKNTNDFHLLQGTSANEGSVVINPVDQKSMENDFRRKKMYILKSASEIIKSRSIEEMVKRIKRFSQRFPRELLNEKPVRPFIQKFKGDFKKIITKGKTILETARKLEKSGKKKTNKQLAALKTNVKTFSNQVKKFIKSIHSESQKQRNKHLKLVKLNPNNINLLRNAKRCINIVDLLSETVRLLQSIPSRINCFIFGNCESNNENTDGASSVGGNDDNDNDDDIDDDVVGDDEGAEESVDEGVDEADDDDGGSD